MLEANVDLNSQPARVGAAFRMLSKGAQSLRKAMRDIYGKFLQSNLLLARLTNIQTVGDFLSFCAEDASPENRAACGNVKTSAVDVELFVTQSLYSVHMPIFASSTDIAILSDTSIGTVFSAWHAQLQGRRDPNFGVTQRAKDIGPSRRCFFVNVASISTQNDSSKAQCVKIRF